MDRQQVDGPADWQVAWYVREVETQCSYGLAGRDALAQALNSRDVVGTMRALQAMLSAAAALRRLFLPNRQASRPGQQPTDRGRALQQFATSRGRRLRRELGLKPEESPLAQDRLRNVIEHFDEYIDEWFFDGNEVVIDRIVTDDDSAINIGGQTPPTLRKYNSTLHVASVLETSVELGPLVLELRRLRSAASAWLASQRS